jgi:hypothetical protein
MADMINGQTWEEVVAHIERIKAAAQMGLRNCASIKALADSCAVEAVREVGGGGGRSDAERVHLIAQYAVGLALARYGELFPHDREWLEEQVKVTP